MDPAALQIMFEFWNKTAVYFGGASVILVAICGFISKFVADKTIEGRKAELSQETEKLKTELSKDVEKYKLSLKKQEFIFNKEVEATSALIDLRLRIMPVSSHPDEEWRDACAAVAKDLEKIGLDIRNYTVKYGAVITSDLRSKIDECHDIAETYKFEGYEESEPQLYEQAISRTEDMLRILTEIEKSMIASIRAGL